MKNTYHTTRKALMATAISIGLVPLAQAAPDPYAKPNESWISISGEVKSVTPDAFLLDYDGGAVTVEMDDFDNDADGYKLLEGDDVRVYGRIDDDMFETTSIEASSVWVDGLNTYFYANSADEEDIPSQATLTLGESDVQVTGTIGSIEGREFTIDTGTRELRADTAELGYNPFDDEGYQKLAIGDRVYVTGEVDKDWWEKRELMIDAVVTLKDASASDDG